MSSNLFLWFYVYYCLQAWHSLELTKHKMTLWNLKFLWTLLSVIPEEDSEGDDVDVDELAVDIDIPVATEPPRGTFT